MNKLAQKKSSTLFHGQRQHDDTHLLPLAAQDKLAEENQITNWYQKY